MPKQTTIKDVLERFNKEFEERFGFLSEERATILAFKEIKNFFRTFIRSQIESIINSCPISEEVEYYNDMTEEKQKETDSMFIDYVAVDGFNEA